MAKIPENINSYGIYYSDSSLLEKIANVARKEGKKVIKKVVKLALTLYYVLISGDVPFENKAQIIGALGYFIFPQDGVPDYIPLVGYGDDFVVLLFVYNKVKSSITPDVENRVNDKMSSLGL